MWKDHLNRLLWGCFAWVAISSVAVGQPYYASPVPGGGYKVLDPATGKVTYTSDLQQFARKQEKTENGFGPALSYEEFARGKTPVRDTVNAAARATDYTANAALNTARYFPGYRQAAGGLQQVMKSGSQQRRP